MLTEKKAILVEKFLEENNCKRYDSNYKTKCRKKNNSKTKNLKITTNHSLTEL